MGSRKSVFVALFPVLVLWASLSAVDFLGFLSYLENPVLDWRFRLRGNIKLDPRLVIIDISEDATEEFGPWPLPRHLHGMFIDAVTNLGAKAVVYDVFFSRATEQKSDAFLLEMSKESGNVHYPLRLSPYPEAFAIDSAHTPDIIALSVKNVRPNHDMLQMKGLLSQPLSGLAGVSRSMGFVNLVNDPDGIVRRTPLFMACQSFVFPQLALPVWLSDQQYSLEALRFDPSQLKLQGDAAPPIPLDGSGNLIINWPGKWEQLPHFSFREILISYKQVMEGVEPILPIDSLRALKGKILVVGHVDRTAQDYYSNPLENRQPMIGLQFSILNTLLQHNAIIPMDLAQRSALLLAFLLLCQLILYGERVAWKGRMLEILRESFPWQLAVIILSTGFAAFSQVVFVRYNLWIPLVSVTIAGIGLLIWHNAARYYAEVQVKRKLKSTFARYVTQEVMEQLLDKPELAQLGGRKEEVTILFSDIRGFTSLSETLEPKDVVALLNEYLTVMTPIVFQNHGIIDKFAGDEIMAYFGAPVYPEDHAWRAVKTALEMQEALVPLRERWHSEARPDVQIGIGINTGKVIMGNIGSELRMDFTLIGDDVNIGARLCSKAEAGETLISASTYKATYQRIEVEESREIMVKGKSKPIRVYSISRILSEPTKDRRQFERAEVSMSAMILSGQSELSEEVLADIGGGGFRCVSRHAHVHDDIVSITFTLPNGILIEQATARIIGVAPIEGGTRIHATFVEIKPQDREEIVKLVRARNSVGTE